MNLAVPIAAPAASTTIRVGVYQSPPKLFVDKNGKAGGIWVGIFDHIARKENWKVVYVPGVWQQCLDWLDSGEIDVMMDVAWSSDRVTHLDFNQVSVLSNWVVVYVHEHQAVTEITDLANKSIAAMQGGVAMEVFKQFDIPCTIVPVDSYKDAFDAVDQGRASAALISQFYGMAHEKKHKVKRTSIVFSPLNFHFAVLKGMQPDLLAAIDTHLSALKADKASIYYRHLKKLLWSGHDPEIPAWVFCSLVLGGFLLVVAFVFMAVLKHQVARRTRDLKASEERYRIHFENVSDILYCLDREFRITYISPSVERLLGYRADVLVGRSFLDLNLLVWEDVERAVADAQVCFSGKVVPPTVYSVIAKNGQRIALEISSNFFLKNGGVDSIISVARDVTFRENMVALTRIERDLALRLSTASILDDGLRACVSAVLDVSGINVAGIYLLDKAGIGFDLACHGGDTVACGDLLSRWEKGTKLSRMIMAGEAVYMPYRDVPSSFNQDECSENQRFMEVAILPIHDHGRVIGCLYAGAFVQNPIVEFRRTCLEAIVRFMGNAIVRFQMEEDAHALGRRLTETMDSMMEGCRIIDRDWRYLYVNPEAEKQLGKSREKLMGMTLETAWPDLRGTTLFAAMKCCMEDRTPRRIEAQSDYLDGKINWFEFFIQPISEGLFVLSQDITRRRKAEEELRLSNANLERRVEERTRDLESARHRAETADRAKSVFLANMSHEIRTPMNAILGFAQLLEHDSQLTPDQAEHIRSIRCSGEHLLKLINDILDISKIEAGKSVLSPVSFCLHDFLEDLTTMFRSRAHAKGLQLYVEREESVPQYVSADENKLRQIIINLMGNAVKFTKAGGVALRVTAGAVKGKHAGEDEDRKLCLKMEVEDSGPGIPEEDLGNIFDPFHQAETGNIEGGTGLGLPISRRFIEMMGGTITVTSRVSKGSCFRFDVPVSLVNAPEIPRELARRQIVAIKPDMAPCRILVVDDMADNRTLLRGLLQPVGFEIAEAVNGAEALKHVAKWSPHAVLMDMRMPVMDGYEATRRIKAKANTRHIPIIAVTASAFEDSRKQVMNSGVDFYLRKPFRSEELFGALETTLGLGYIYADEITAVPGTLKSHSLDMGSLAALPTEMIREMDGAVADGDIASLTELIVKAEAIDSIAASELRVLAADFNYEKLRIWLKREGDNNG